MSTFVLSLADPSATLETVGGKGMSLAKLARAGLPVPDGFHVTTDAYRCFIAKNGLQEKILTALQAVDALDPSGLELISQQIGQYFTEGVIPPEITEVVTTAYAALVRGGAVREVIPVAVRSSATVEDLPGASFAGQQETYLNICGAESVLEAVKKCWASLWTARAIAYRTRLEIPPESIALAVVVQELVFADAAGVLFTANPVSGKRDELMITATWGLGEAIVSGMVTPDTLIVEKATGRLLRRLTSEKQVMTVRTESGTGERPIPSHLKKKPVLSNSQATVLSKQGIEIEKLYGIPMDIEWTLAGGKFAIVQARPVTNLAIQPNEPAKWKLPKGSYAAMRNNIVELMADPLSPLFATLGLSAINISLNRFMGESFGMPGVMPKEIILVVNHYAYNNGSLSARNMLRVLFDARKIMKKMFTGAIERWTEDGRPQYIKTVMAWQAKPWRLFGSTELVTSVQQLTEVAIDAYGALISGVIPAAWMTEALFTRIYNVLIKRRSDPSAATFLLGFDSLPIRAEKSLYSLAEWTHPYPALLQFLERTPTGKLIEIYKSEILPGDLPADLWKDWWLHFQEHQRKFGYTIYDLDFAHPVPMDDPAPVMDTLKLYLRGQGVNPYTRQKETAERREQATQAMTQRLKGLRLKWFQKYLASAQKYALMREDGLAEIGLAYPLIRQMLRELGSRFVQNKIISEPDDIFWLTQEEVTARTTQLDSGLPIHPLASVVPQRKDDYQAAQRLSPPTRLPHVNIFRSDRLPLNSRRERGSKEKRIRGVATSPGKVTGIARVLHGPEDFNQMRPGDVLVAAITTPAWTPLFAMASAVVTDIGGPLSHGSIVAREYGIPAVLGTGSATRRIQSGETITVDGSAGTVTLYGKE